MLIIGCATKENVLSGVEKNIKNKEFAKAMIALMDQLTLHPTDTASRSTLIKVVELLSQQYESKNLSDDDMIRFSDEILEKYPKDKSALLIKSYSLSNKGYHEKSLHVIENLILLYPGDFESYYRKGEELMELKRYREAIIEFTTVQGIAPEHRYSRSERGLAKYMLDDKKGACEDWLESGGIASKYRVKYCGEKE